MDLIFNGTHSSNDLGLKMYSKVRHILPEPKLVYEDIPGTDGEYDFSEVNPDNRTKYKPFTEEITFSIIELNSTAIRIKAREIAKWLSCGEQKLIYDDEPNVYYLARIINKLDIENQLIKLKSFTALFKCRPYGYALNELSESFEGIIIGESQIINNPGTYVKPVITITGTFSTLTLTLVDKTLTYSDAINEAEIVIDCENMSCVKDEYINKNNKLSGEFFEFENGNNILEIDGTNLNCNVEVRFRPRYL